MATWRERKQQWRNHIAELPTTNLRIYTTLILTVLTAIVYLGLPVARLVLIGTGMDLATYVLWEPSWEWLAFLAAISGIDVAQFTAKRATHREPNGNGHKEEELNA